MKTLPLIILGAAALALGACTDTNPEQTATAAAMPDTATPAPADAAPSQTAETEENLPPVNLPPVSN
ncbi:MAG: hypothetical protein Q7V15_12540 [Phenylobacterium sp.]|uniref:hypothetical protein n=1 Tax=Phenylobacterium sp. TaxID=1871053 RepID=UPI00271763DC|nr:hypothetical protein [Phenylobacterium sp.]MDO8902170.1 hypothetical protein [Phenylobacterium sp.]